MHHEHLTRIIVLAAGVGVLGLAVHTTGGGVATAASEPSPSASPSSEPTATPSPVPASAAVVGRALKQRHRAVDAWREWSRARSALSLGVVPFRVHSAAKPDRAEPEARWVAAAQGWRVDRHEYVGRTGKLVERMRKPGGGGAARWWPAALWCGWEPSLRSWFCYVVWRESSARPLAVNASSGCFGLLQLHPMFWASKGIAWIRDPLNQLRMGWKLYRECGARPWAL